MSWASERRTFIVVGISLVVAAAVAVIAISIFYETPSCSDGKQNQGEGGVDCGGSCARVCSADVVPPVVSYVRPLTDMNGRTDIVAYIENPNPSASAKSARYTIELYSVERVLLDTVDGMIDLPPATDVPIYIPNAYQGPVPIAQAFLVFDLSSFTWVRGSEAPPTLTVSEIQSQDTETKPRVTAILTNPTVKVMKNIPVIATLYDAEDRVMAASRTLIAEIVARESVDVVFTWTEPFTTVPARIDVRPITTLPKAP